MPLAVTLGHSDDERFKSDAWPIPSVLGEHAVLVGGAQHR